MSCTVIVFRFEPLLSWSLFGREKGEGNFKTDYVIIPENCVIHMHLLYMVYSQLQND